MAKQRGLAHSNRFPTISEKIKPAKNKTYTVIKIWTFLTNKGVFDNICKILRFCILGPRLSSLET